MSWAVDRPGSESTASLSRIRLIDMAQRQSPTTMTLQKTLRTLASHLLDGARRIYTSSTVGASVANAYLCCGEDSFPYLCSTLSAEQTLFDHFPE